MGILTFFQFDASPARDLSNLEFVEVGIGMLLSMGSAARINESQTSFEEISNLRLLRVVHDSNLP